MQLKSDILKFKVETTPHRALLRATWVTSDDLSSSKPFIWIANSYTNVVPGHIHLNMLTEEVKRWIRDAWWVPFVWWVPAVCDWIAMYAEMRLSLPSRDNIADNIEIMMLSHSFDWWVWVTNCDKITPGMLIAAWRLDLPCVILTGWPMKSWSHKTDLISAFEKVWAYKHWNITKQELSATECNSCPWAGSCAWLFTANSMACMTEVLGLSLTDCACTLAVSPQKKIQAYESGLKIVELVKKGIKARSIMTKNAFRDCMTIDNAIWWSTNVTLHLPEIAKESGITISLQDFDSISKVTPNICHIRPSGPYMMEDLDRAWWIKAVMKRLSSQLNLDRNWVSWCFKDIIAQAEILDEEVIRPLDNPYFKEWWVACLKWNFCEESVVKQTWVEVNMLVHSWPARVFYSEDELLSWIEKWIIKEWDVIVLPFQWRAWAPWMPEMLTPTAAIKWAGYQRVALITDWRFSWGTSGPCIGHIFPEAFNWGRIWLLRDWDVIEINMIDRCINAKVTEEEFELRRQLWIKAPDRALTPLLVKYRKNFS